MLQMQTTIVPDFKPSCVGHAQDVSFREDLLELVVLVLVAAAGPNVPVCLGCPSVALSPALAAPLRPRRL